MALLVGILVGLGRLSADRETVALLACGVSPYRLLRPIGALAVAAAVVTLYVMVVAIPHANRTFLAITFDIISKRVETDVRPRVFFEDFPGWVLYAGDEAGPGEAGWRRLLVADTSRPDRRRRLLRASGAGSSSTARSAPSIWCSTTGRCTRPDRPAKPTPCASTGNTWSPSIPRRSSLRCTIQKGPNEKTIGELRADAAKKVQAGISPHPEIIALQQKFSFPVACLVFGLIGLAVGLTVARDGKLAGFVVGIVIIFAYYIVMFLLPSR